MLQRTTGERIALRASRAILTTCVLASVLCRFGAAAAQVAEPAMVHDFHDAKHWATVFESPERAKWQKPDEVVSALELKPGQTVADIGAGTGYFTRRFAAAVGPDGEAIGLDIEPAMVEYMKQDAARRHLKNYIARLSKPDAAGLAPHSVDLIFFCDVYHHVPGRIAYLKQLAAALRPGGRIVIIDFHRSAPVGSPAAMRIPRQQAIAEFGQAGYRMVGSKDFLPYQYFLEFVPAGAPVESGSHS